MLFPKWLSLVLSEHGIVHQPVYQFYINLLRLFPGPYDWSVFIFVPRYKTILDLLGLDFILKSDWTDSFKYFKVYLFKSNGKVVVCSENIC